MPTNIKRTKKSGWTKVRQAGLFGNDYVTANKVGQVLTLPAVRKVQEVRLLAPTGPTFGKIEVRIGTSQWYTVDLYSKKPRRHDAARGARRVRAAADREDPDPGQAAGRSRTAVRVDAIVARGGSSA